MSATELYPQVKTFAPASDKAAAALRVNGLTVVRGARMLFQNVSFEVNSGAVLVLQGPNGCGKTSLLRVLGDALPPTAGTIMRADARPPAFMPADDLLWQGTETVRDALGFWARLVGSDADAALRAVGLASVGQRPLAQLSTGQRRRLSCARLLLQPATLWLLDEPLIGLDTAGRATLATLVAGHIKAGGAAVIASHEPLPDMPGITPTTMVLAGVS